MGTIPTEGVKTPLFDKMIYIYELLFSETNTIPLVSGRDLMTAVVGLFEATKESYLRSRISQVREFAEKLSARNIPVLLPAGGHAVYLDMDKFFAGCHRDPGDFPSVGFTVELLKHYGIRATELGPFAWEWEKKSAEERKTIPNLVRFAVPRYALLDSHIDYTVSAIQELHHRRDTIPNMKITRGQDMALRHFSCGMAPVNMSPDVGGIGLGECAAVKCAVRISETAPDRGES